MPGSIKDRISRRHQSAASAVHCNRSSRQIISSQDYESGPAQLSILLLLAALCCKPSMYVNKDSPQVVLYVLNPGLSFYGGN